MTPRLVPSIPAIVRVAALAASALAVPTASHATAFFYANLYQTNKVPMWRFILDTSDPGGPNNCLNHGANYSSYINQASTPIEAVSIGPPFSGSASRTRYLSACYDSSHYVVVKMTVSLSGCAAWVCTTKRNFEVMHVSGGSYGYAMGFFGSIGITNDLKVTLPNYP